MTSRERWMAALQCQPIDRLPFWPKLNVAYTPYQREPFRRMSIEELHSWIGSDRHVGGPPCTKEIRRKTQLKKTERNGERQIVFETPVGSLTSIQQFDAASHSWHPKDYPIKSSEDIDVMAYFFADVDYEFDIPQFERALALVQDLGEDGVATTGIGISPLMEWIQHLAGLENGLLFLMDYPEKVEALMRAMHSVTCKRARIIAERSPYQVIYSVENTSTTLISPDLFRRYCYRHLTEYGEIIAASGKLHLLHMCGHLKALLRDISDLPACGIEAFTSPPVGNTTLVDGRIACPQKCLIGGTNALLWLEPVEKIKETIRHDLAMLPHLRGIVITSAGVMPPFCSPETIKEVCEWVKNYEVV